MKDTIRLLVTKNCNRNCKGCCNDKYDLDNLPIFNDEFYRTNKKHIKMIIITGGEPLLYQDKLSNYLISRHDWSVNWIIYTAYVKDYFKHLRFIGLIDGLTLSFHDQQDVDDAKKFLLDQCTRKNKSFRLNIFDGIDISYISDFLSNWKIKKMEWLENCPIPNNETLMRLENLW